MELVIGLPPRHGVEWVAREMIWGGRAHPLVVHGSAAKHIHRGTRKIEEFTEQERFWHFARRQDSSASRKPGFNGFARTSGFKRFART
jgi:hypothetical protein